MVMVMVFPWNMRGFRLEEDDPDNGQSEQKSEGCSNKGERDPALSAPLEK